MDEQKLTEMILKALSRLQPEFNKEDKEDKFILPPREYRKQIIQTAIRLADDYESKWMRECTSPKVNRKKQIITVKDLDYFAATGEIRLYPGDIMTDLAREKAKDLNINLIHITS
ncbi:MAG: hypothetical protein LBN22_09895 [Clostridiales Family XIII bacterium]|nr:hypothetical protein [Clostridiales Family XIII bacterium]